MSRAVSREPGAIHVTTFAEGANNGRSERAYRYRGRPGWNPADVLAARASRDATRYECPPPFGCGAEPGDPCRALTEKAGVSYPHLARRMVMLDDHPVIDDEDAALRLKYWVRAKSERHGFGGEADEQLCRRCGKHRDALHHRRYVIARTA